LEDPQYLPNHWESAVADLINKIENSTGTNSVVGEAAVGSPAVSVPAANSTTVVPVVQSVVPNITIPSGHHAAGLPSATADPADNVSLGMSMGGRAAHKIPLPAEPWHKASPPSSGTIVVPVMVPYLVLGSAVPAPTAAPPPALPPSPAMSPNAGQLVGYCLISSYFLYA